MSSIVDINLGLLLLALSVLAALATAILNYLSRPLLVRTIERHSDELKQIAEDWFKGVPVIPRPSDIVRKQPNPIKIPSEDILLFHDLREHSPKELKVFETWDQFKQKINEYNKKRFSICQKVLDQVTSEAQIPVVFISNETGLYYPNFIEAVCLDANALARGARPYYKRLIETAKPEQRGEMWEFWPDGNLYARGNKDVVERAIEYMITFLNKLEEKSYTKIASDLVQEEEKLNELREEVIRKIRDLIAIPIFPGKCIYSKRAVPGVYERIKTLLSRWLKLIRQTLYKPK